MKKTHVSSHVTISHVNLEPPDVTWDFPITCESHVRTSHVNVPNSHVCNTVISQVRTPHVGTSHVIVPNSHVSDTQISRVRTSHVMALNSHVSQFVISHVSYLCVTKTGLVLKLHNNSQLPNILIKNRWPYFAPNKKYIINRK